MDVPVNAEKPVAFENMESHLSSYTELSSINSTRRISLSVRASDGLSVLAPIRDIHLEGCGSEIFVIDCGQGR